MLRVIHSSVQTVGIDTDQEDGFEAAVRSGEQLRETYSKDARYDLVAYIDPDGLHRFAVRISEPSAYDWQDTHSFDEALALYEESVREAAEGMWTAVDEETGDELPPFEFTDVPGVQGYESGAEEAGTIKGRMLDAEWATEEADKAQRAADGTTRARQIAYARAIDKFGRGGNAYLARRLGLSEPTVKAIADRGRQILAEQAEGTTVGV
ncbi:hypothetical protein RM863_29285 [Streptomyces sp. DSM 41014]|uniref:Helix-turn-helix DNA binding domain protein n=1 Tax=Streptomyces hintoniae TaxID=3075521 RepID=A0ABU2USG6_9ACTN|nr:hypothetical protein [Streptomyces sp. DSM 41014]MDT0476226.1 hypothetical protein [Streptomyces sp. DSM 41014]